MDSKITNNHLIRIAIIYIRQSHPHQVKNHKESQRLQYQLVERAKQLGWVEVIIIDDDLGHSADGTVVRCGFERLLLAVKSKKVRAIFCIDASRFARNNREWYLLLDYCRYSETLVIDTDGVYDPNNTKVQWKLSLLLSMISTGRSEVMPQRHWVGSGIRVRWNP